MRFEMHALTRPADGFVEMAYRGATRWHEPGQLLEGSDSDQWIVQAGTNWKIQRNSTDSANVPATTIFLRAQRWAVSSAFR
jgi:hypothetical protein